jgi:hypothetical protein
MRIFHKNRPEPTSTPTPAAGQDAPARDAAAPSRQPSPLSAGASISARTSDESAQRPRGNFGNMMGRLHLGSGRDAQAPTVTNSPNSPSPGSALAQGRGADASMLRGAALIEQSAATRELNREVQNLTAVLAERGQLIADVQRLTKTLESASHPHGQMSDPSGLAAPKAHERANPGTLPAPDTENSFVDEAVFLHEIKISGQTTGVGTSSGPLGRWHDRAQQQFDERLGQPAVGTGKAQPDAALDFASKLPKDLGDKYLNATERLNEAVSSAEKQYGTDHAAFPPGIKESISGIRDQQNAVVDQAMTRMLFPK